MTSPSANGVSRTRTVEQLCSLIADCPHSSPEWTETGVVVLRSRNIRQGRLDLGAQRSFTTEADYTKRVKRAIPQGGDLVITREAPMGEVCMLPEGLRCCMGQRMVLLRPDPAVVEGRFLLFALQSQPVQQQIGMHEGTGSTVSNLRIPALEALDIPWFPVDEQLRIAGVLGALDDKIELNRKMNRTLEEMAQAIFKSWFIDFDGVDASEMVDSELAPIPKGWEVRPLDTIAEFLNGAACQKYPAEEGEGSLPVIKIRELNQGITERTDRATTQIPRKWWVEDGDVLFSWSGSLVVTVWTGGPGALNQHLFKISSESFPRWFYLYWTKHHLKDFQRIAADKATTMGHIKRHHLSDALCAAPPYDVVERQSATFAPIVARIAANELQSRTLASLRDALLPKLISGEIRVPEAEKAIEAAV